MKGYDYRQAVVDDVLQYLKDNGIKVTRENRDELEDQLRDDLWTEDSVTGNGSGSYTFDADTAAEYVIPNLDLFADAFDEFGGDAVATLRQGVEAMDVTIRCYLLPEAIAEALDEVEDNAVTDSIGKTRPTRSAVRAAVQAASQKGKTKKKNTKNK